MAHPSNRARRAFLILSLNLALGLANAWAGQPLAVELIPEADAFVTPGVANEAVDWNFGTSGALSASPPEAGKGEQQSVMRFDTAEARAAFEEAFGPGQWRVANVELRLSLAEARNPIFNPNAAGKFQIAWLPADDWEEGTGRPAMPADDGIAWTIFSQLISGAPSGGNFLGEFDYDGIVAGTLFATLDLTPEFLFDLESDDSTTLRVHAAANGANLVFNSRNVGNANAWPRLTITAAATAVVLSPELAISYSSNGGAFVQISWDAEMGAMYQVQSKEDLNANEWSAEGSSIAAAGVRTAVEVPITSDVRARFFRIIVVQP